MGRRGGYDLLYRFDRNNGPFDSLSFGVPVTAPHDKLAVSALDKAARALCDWDRAEDYPDDLRLSWEEVRDEYLAGARAVLMAVRDHAADIAAGAFGAASYRDEQDFTAMIDAILNEGPR